MTHSVLTGGFAYKGAHFTGKRAAIAIGDNFVSILMPLIEQITVFQHGTASIELWCDESEGLEAHARSVG